MVFTAEDKILIKHLVLLKDYSSRRLIKELPNNGWNKNGLDKLLRKIRATDSVDRKPGSGRPRSMRTAEKIEAVQDLVTEPGGQASNSSINSSDFKRNWNKSAYSGQNNS